MLPRQEQAPMPRTLFHASVEGAQHGAKSLADFLAHAKRSGAAGAQPSVTALEHVVGGLRAGGAGPFCVSEEIREALGPMLRAFNTGMKQGSWHRCLFLSGEHLRGGFALLGIMQKSSKYT